MIMRMFKTALLASFFASVSLFSAEQRTDVAVLYNSGMAESLAVAEHYAKARNISRENLIGLRLSEKEAVTRDEFVSSIQKPLWNWFIEKKHFILQDKASTNPPVGSADIRYLTICYGVPVKILRDASLSEPAGEKLPEELRRNEAAVDSELAALPLLPSNPPAVGLFNTQAFGATNAAAVHPTNGVLMVARLDGPSAELAKGLVDKALAAEKNGLWGRGYFDARGLTSGGYESGDKWITLVSEMAKTYGFEVTLDKQPTTFPSTAPFSDIALYFGWYDTQLSGPFLHENPGFVPGAIAYHLYSFSAQSIRGMDMNWAPNLIRRGATATVGYTEEPYLQFTLDLPVFAQRLFFRGFTFGEAVYAGLAGSSWQTTVIGDPLYRPFGNQSAEFFGHAINQTNRIGEWALLTQMNRNLAVQPSAAGQILSEVLRIPRTTNSPILMEKVADLQKSRADFSQAVRSYQAALQLNPSLMQRLRLVQNIGTIYKTMGKNKEGYELYNNLLKQNEFYKGRKEVYESLAHFAEAIGKKQEAEEYRKLAKP